MTSATRACVADGEEPALLARARDGAAFAELVRLHSGLVRGVAVGVLGSQEGEDACQEVWLSVWLGVGAFRGESSLRTWLYRVARNTCLTRQNAAARRRSREEGGWRPPDPGGPEDGPEVVPAADERRREAGCLIREMLYGLRGEHRSALVLRHAGGLSYPEVAKVLGVPTGTAKGWAHRAKVKARDAAPATRRGSAPPLAPDEGRAIDGDTGDERSPRGEKG